MTEYIFLFGKNKELSILELVSYLIKKELKYRISKITEDYAFIEINNFNYNKAINELGGILKIGEFFDLKDLKIYKNKVNYGLNLFYNETKILRELKDLFKKENVKALLRKPRKRNVFSPKESNKLDIELIVFKNKTGRVVVNSKPSLYKQRDENRPYFDRLRTTSLRLCKILINLSQAKENEILIDPFAGTGSILQEAMILGINVIGIEKESECAEGMIKNLNWVKEKYKLKTDFRVYNIDNKDIDTVVEYGNCAVTEPYFGPFFKIVPRYEEVLNIVKELEKSYYLLLKKLKSIIKKNGFIVFLVPVYKSSRGIVKIGFEEIINKLGFSLYSPVKNINIPIKYKLKNSIVEREIYIFKNT